MAFFNNLGKVWFCFMDVMSNWNEIKETVRREYNLSDISYRTWIESLEFLSVENDVVNILIPSDQANALDYISKKFANFFKVSITEMFDHDYEVRFLLANETNAGNSSAPTEKVVEKSSVNNVNHENANLIPRYRFDTFVVGSNNKFAHASSLAVAESYPVIANVHGGGWFYGDKQLYSLYTKYLAAQAALSGASSCPAVSV